MKSTITVKGTHCKSCKMLIEDVCKDIPGITSCIVNFKTGKTVIEHEKMEDLKKLKAEIDSLGQYEVSL